MPMNPLDLGVIAVLAAFALWGVWRGPLKPLAGLMLLAAAIFAAGRLAGPLTATTARVSGLGPVDAEGVAWAVVWFATLVIGSAVLAIVSPWIRTLGPGGAFGRLVGGLLGAVQGAAWIAIALFVLAGSDGTASPSLSRERGPANDPGVDRFADLRAAELAARLGARVREALPLPSAISERLAAAERRLGGED